MAFKRLPNGAGTVTKLKQKLRRPFRAQKLVGTRLDGLRTIYIYKTVGYFETRKDALDALLREGTASTMETAPTFETVFTLAYAEKEGSICNARKAVYKRFFSQTEDLHKRTFRTLKTADFDPIIASQPPTMQGEFKVVLSAMYKYALRNELCDKDYSKLVTANTKHDKRSKVPFSVAEVEEMRKHTGELFYDMALIGIYTGLRPTELRTLQTTDIQGGCLVCGIKTENGKNRRVPIHPDILPLIQEYARKAAFLERTGLFQKMSKETYRDRFARLFPTHTPHETRHSFATYARRSGLDPIMIKRIMGHTLNDLTEAVYTHIDDDILIAEIKKFRIA